MTTYVPSTIEIADDSPEAIAELFEARGLGDGLPVVAPTAPRVDAMLERAVGDPDEVLATLLPRAGIVTRRVVAINAVLAGCTPEAFPVVLTAIRALARPEMNLRGVNATTHPVAPMVLVHGEIVTTARFASGSARSAPATGPMRPSAARCASSCSTSREHARARATQPRTDNPRSTRSARPRTSTRHRGRATRRVAACSRRAR